MQKLPKLFPTLISFYGYGTLLYNPFPEFTPARIWKITFIDQKAKKIGVIPAKDGKKPKFFGGGGAICQRIRKKMLQIIYSKDNYEFLDPLGREEIDALRKDFSVFDIKNLHAERPY